MSCKYHLIDRHDHVVVINTLINNQLINVQIQMRKTNKKINNSLS